MHNSVKELANSVKEPEFEMMVVSLECSVVKPVEMLCTATCNNGTWAYKKCHALIQLPVLIAESACMQQLCMLTRKQWTLGEPPNDAMQTQVLKQLVRAVKTSCHPDFWSAVVVSCSQCSISRGSKGCWRPKQSGAAPKQNEC